MISASLYSYIFYSLIDRLVFSNALLKKGYPEPSIVLQILLCLLHFNYSFSLDYFLRHYFQGTFLTSRHLCRLLFLPKSLFSSFFAELVPSCFQTSPLMSCSLETSQPYYLRVIHTSTHLHINLFTFFITLGIFLIALFLCSACLAC